MTLIAEFKTEDIVSNVTEKNVIDFTDTRNNIGPKHLLVKNTGTHDAILRYWYADVMEDYPVMKSVDADVENLVPAGESKHIVLEGSQFVEMIQIGAILPAPGSAILSGKLIAPPYIGNTDRG